MGRKQSQLEGVITFMSNGVLALTMEEDWDDETPAWTVSEEPEYDPVQALKDLTPLAEFLMSSASSLSFKGVRTGVEFDGEFLFETIELKDFKQAYIKMCYHKGGLVSVAVCHRDYDAPQIILPAPDVFVEG